jgi:hypothetical protein
MKEGDGSVMSAIASNSTRRCADPIRSEGGNVSWLAGEESGVHLQLELRSELGVGQSDPNMGHKWLLVVARSESGWRCGSRGGEFWPRHVHGH